MIGYRRIFIHLVHDVLTDSLKELIPLHLDVCFIYKDLVFDKTLKGGVPPHRLQSSHFQLITFFPE